MTCACLFEYCPITEIRKHINLDECKPKITLKMIPGIFRRNLTSTQSYCFRRKNKSINRNFYRVFSNAVNDENSSKQSSEQNLKKLLQNSLTFVDVNSDDKWATLPYAEGTILSKEERTELDVERPKVDPRDTSIILFPGQGAQFVGMAKSLKVAPVARDVFDYASEILGYETISIILLSCFFKIYFLKSQV